MALLLRLLLFCVPRLMLGLALWRRLTGRETARDLAERRGRHGPAGAVWVHGASNGELASARWVIAELAARGPVLVTSSTVTGREMVRAWAIPGLRVGLAPLDMAGALRTFLAGGARAFVNLEGEFWPARFAALAARGVPVALIGARMSRGSARLWHRAGAGFLQSVRLCAAQDEGSARRLAELGLPDSARRPLVDLKAEAVARLPAPVWAPRSGRARVLLAASTHEGEEAPILRAFAESPAFDLLILAPRHARRGDAVALLVAEAGLPLARRSLGAALPGRGVYLADTMGEMDLWYAAAGACFVGGSLVDRGGHTPWEPARHGAAILHGPHIGNFAAAYARLDGASAAIACTAETLGAALDRLSAPVQDRMAAAATGFLHQDGAGQALLAELLALIETK